MAEFMNLELTNWEAKCRKALPDYDVLRGDCAGAIDRLPITAVRRAFMLPAEAGYGPAGGDPCRAAEA